MKFDTFGDLNYLAVLAGAVAYWILGSLWYTVLFGKPWMKATGVTPENAGGAGNQAALYGFSFVLFFVTSTAVAFLAKEAQAANLNDALQLGLGTGVGFSAVAIIVTQMYERRPPVLMAINAGYNVLGVVLASIIVTLWD